MAVINKKYEEQIITCQPLVWHGLTLQPIRINKKSLWDSCKNCLTVMQQELPLELASMSYLKMLYAIGAMDNLKKVLLLALGLIKKDDNGEYIYETERIEVMGIDGELTALSIRQYDTFIRVSDIEFATLRSLIAEQNLLKLPNEAHNTELLEAQQDLAEISANNDIEFDFEYELYFVARNSGLPLSQVYNMSIREFYKTMGSANIQIYNAQCAAAEAAGCKYKNGNPHPNPVYPRHEIPIHVQSEADMQKRKSFMG